MSSYCRLFPVSVVLLALSLCGTAPAVHNQNVTSFSLFYVGKDGQTLEKIFKYDELKSNGSFKAKSPHGMLNPEGKIEEWSGVTVPSLMEKIGKADSKSTSDVTVIGFDGYLAQMEMRDFYNPNAILATHANGVKVAANKGGPQLFFPNQDPSLRKELLFEGWGVWYVTAFIVGDLNPRVPLLSGNGAPKVASLENLKGTTRASTIYFPPGHFRTPVAQKTVNIETQNFYTWLQSQTDKKFEKLQVATYYGDSVPISGKFEDFDIVFRWDGKTIPAKFGGPIHICPKGKVSNCLFFVKSIHLGG